MNRGMCSSERNAYSLIHPVNRRYKGGNPAMLFRQAQLAQGLMRRGDISEKTVEKILSDNPQRLCHF
jgi:hypothetical protein